jgi:hypothetical protein
MQYLLTLMLVSVHGIIYLLGILQVIATHLSKQNNEPNIVNFNYLSAESTVLEVIFIRNLGVS